MFAICSGRDCDNWVGNREWHHLQEPAGGESITNHINSRDGDMSIKYLQGLHLSPEKEIIACWCDTTWACRWSGLVFYGHNKISLIEVK